MPELPEVETIRSHLEPGVTGKQIIKVDIRLPRLLENPVKDFKKAVEKREITKLERRGKYLLFHLESGSFCIHLGMTGQLSFSPSDYKENFHFTKTITGLQKPLGVHPVDKHTHVVFYLSTGERLLFRDPRTFGKLFLTGNFPLNHPRLFKLGPDPLKIRVQAFLSGHGRRFLNSTRNIKAVLLDQTFLSGVGNIYADEALFLSCLHPQTPVNEISPTKMHALLLNVKKALRKGIKNFGTTFSDYRKPDGTAGANLERLQVYGRQGKPCLRCGTTLEKMVVSQRGTVICSKCQG